MSERVSGTKYPLEVGKTPTLVAVVIVRTLRYALSTDHDAMDGRVDLITNHSQHLLVDTI